MFTINGFPFGRFHGERVKERVYLPDWTSPERLEYTNRLFDLLAQLLPEGVAGSVSTVPGSFKEFITAPGQLAAIGGNLHACVKHIAGTAARARTRAEPGLGAGAALPAGNRARNGGLFRPPARGTSRRFAPGGVLGVNYDTCHQAVEFEEPAEALALLQSHRVKISKIHLSNALKLRIADGPDFRPFSEAGGGLRRADWRHLPTGHICIKSLHETPRGNSPVTATWTIS